jgi:hypothetical protein
MLLRRLLLLSLFGTLCFIEGAEAGAYKAPLLDGAGMDQGAATLSLAKGVVKVKAFLEPLPASIDTGGEVFEASHYRAYLVNSTDEAVEVSLGPVYPSTKGVAKVKAAFKGDLSQLGLDRIVVVAFSKDGLHSHDVLTGTIESQ